MRKGIAGWLLVGCTLAAAPAWAETTAPQMDPAISSLLTKHSEAINNHDADGIAALYSAAPDTVLLGTGEGERWIGRDSIKDAYQHFFGHFDKGSVKVECSQRNSGVKGDLAWIASSCKMTDTLKGKQRSFNLNFTAVAEQSAGAWLFRTVHVSNITGDESAEPAADSGKSEPPKAAEPAPAAAQKSAKPK